MSHSEGSANPSGMLIAVESVLGSVAGVSTMILDALDSAPFTSIRIASAIAHHGSEDLVRRELASEDAARIRVIRQRTERRINEHGSPIPGIRGTVAHRSGLGDEAAVLQYLPSTIDEVDWVKIPEPNGDNRNDSGIGGP